MKIHGRFQSIMKLANQLDKSPKQFGTDDLLAHGEIHLIEIIGDNEESSVTDIAKRMEVTKGAISQALKKLESKGYTSKSPDPSNLSRAIVHLTAKGQTAYWSHKDWHEKMDGGFAQYLESLNDDEISTITQFLIRVEVFLERRVKA